VIACSPAVLPTCRLLQVVITTMPTIVLKRAVSLGVGSVVGTDDIVLLDNHPSNPGLLRHSISCPLPAANEFLGAEKTALDGALEEKGVRDILKALSDQERESMPDVCMPIRHLRAEKGNIDTAIQKTKAAIQWRREFGVSDIVNGMENELKDILLEENETGKIYVRGYDNQGRALLYMRPGRENTGIEMNNMRHLVWNLEKAIACTARKSTELGASVPLEKIILVIDYKGFRLKDSPPLSTSKLTLDILQKHYPERMYRAYVVNPGIFHYFWLVIRNFVDANTKEKVVFCSGPDGLTKFTENIGQEHLHKLEPIVGGTHEIPDFHSKQYMHLPFDVSFDETNEVH
jgi:hypothetical protein